MIVTDEHITYIETNLIFYGITSESLREDLIDHLCTFIETNDFENFEEAYQNGLQKLGGYEAMLTMQKKADFEIIGKKQILRMKIIYVLAFIIVFSFCLTAIFKLFHWPFAGIILFTGCILLIFGLLPIFFFDKYQKTIQKLTN